MPGRHLVDASEDLLSTIATKCSARSIPMVPEDLLNQLLDTAVDTSIMTRSGCSSSSYFLPTRPYGWRLPQDHVQVLSRQVCPHQSGICRKPSPRMV